MKKSIIITTCSLLLLGVASYFLLQSSAPVATEDHEENSHDEHGNASHHHEEGEIEEQHHKEVSLSDEELARHGITFAVAGPNVMRIGIELPGEIVLNADRVAHIVPRFPGIAQRVLKDLGEEVREGDILAVIQSNQSVSPYEVKSLVSGTVIEKHLTLGEFVRDDADIYVVADMSTVWVRISVYAKYLQHIRKGQRVTLTAVGLDEAAEGTIDYVGPIVGEKTRTGSARLVLANKNRQWQPGLFVTARVMIDQFSASIAVPDDALQMIDGEQHVFVRSSDGCEARAVKTGRTDAKLVEILEGLSAGEEYVATNSFLLKAELGKSEAGHEH